MEQEYFIEINEGDDKGRRMNLRDSRYTIGRLPENDISFPDNRFVSRQAAVLKKKDGSFVLEDLSSYGLQVNGKAIQGEVRDLQDQDVVKIGENVQITFRTRELSGPLIREEEEDDTTNVSEPVSSEREDRAEETDSLLKNPLVLGGLGVYLVATASLLFVISGSETSTSRPSMQEVSVIKNNLTVYDDNASGSFEEVQRTFLAREKKSEMLFDYLIELSRLLRKRDITSIDRSGEISPGSVETENREIVREYIRIRSRLRGIFQKKIRKARFFEDKQLFRKALTRLNDVLRMIPPPGNPAHRFAVREKERIRDKME